MNLNIVQSTVVGTIRNLQEMKKSYQELPQVDEQQQKPKKKSFKGIVTRQNSQFSKQQKSKIQSQHSQNEKLKQQQKSEQSIAKLEPKQESQDDIQNDPLNDDMNLDPDDFDDKLIEKYKQIKIQEQEQQKTFIQCLNYNKSHEMFQGIEYNQIFSYIVEKGKYIQDFVDKHGINQQFLEKHLINDFHFLKGIN